jgi:hypothetical protein
MTEAGDLWRQFALACAKVIKRKSDQIDLNPIADLLRQCGEAEKRVYRMLASG